MPELTGRVIKVAGRLYHVKTKDEIVICSVRKSVKDKAEYKLSPVVVGDIVEIETDVAGANGVITSVKPRKTLFLKRKAGIKKEKKQVITANIDQMIIVSSVKTPAFKIRLIDRFVITALQGGMKPAIVVNKTDLKHTVDLNRIENIYRSCGIDLIFASTVTHEGINRLKSILKDKQSVFVGQSGTGKSSLLNCVQPGLKLKTGKISEKTGKGKHITTVVELFPLDSGGFVVDTPGLRALGLIKLNKENVNQFYEEILRASHECRFSDCRHKNEPGCAVKAAVKKGTIFAERYESYIRILDDIS